MTVDPFPSCLGICGTVTSSCTVEWPRNSTGKDETVKIDEVAEKLPHGEFAAHSHLGKTEEKILDVGATSFGSQFGIFESVER